MSERTFLIVVLIISAALAAAAVLFLTGKTGGGDLPLRNPSGAGEEAAGDDAAPLLSAIEDPVDELIGDDLEEKSSFTIETIGPKMAHGSYRGRVVNEEGVPVRNATVILFEAATGIFVQEKSYSGHKTSTDGTGVYILDGVPAGRMPGGEEKTQAGMPTGRSFVIRCASDGAADSEVACPPIEAGRIVTVADVVTKSGYTLNGSVTDGQGAPLEGVHVLAVNPLDRAGGLPAGLLNHSEATTDSSGRYRIPHLGPNQYEVTAEIRGYMPSTKSILFGFLGEPTDQVELLFELEKGLFSIAGRVITQTGKAVPRAKITIHSIEAGTRGRFSRTIRAGEDGRFCCDGLSKIRCSLQAEAKGHFLARPVTAASGGDESILLRLDKKGGIEGRVTPGPGSASGLPGGFTIAVDKFVPATPVGTPCEPKEVSFGRKGPFSLSDLLPGTYVLVVRTKGYAWTSSKEIVVEKGKTTGDVTILLSPGGSITGRLFGRGGKAAEGFAISLRHRYYQPGFLFGKPSGDESEQGKATLSGKDGRFLLDNVRPGTYSLEIAGAGMAVKLLREITVSEGKGVDTGGVTITAGGKLIGTACDRHGRPAGGVSVMALNQESGFCKSAITDSRGSFTITALEAGSYTVCLKNTSWSGLGLRSDVTVEVREADTAVVTIQPREPEKKH
jgi:hypothetical protein